VPTYAYACTACEHRFEIVQSFTDDSLTECPECLGRLRKLFNAVGVVFKGSGFYRNDSRNDSRQRTEKGAGKSNGKSNGGSGTTSTPAPSTGSGGSSSDSASSPSAGSSANGGTTKTASRPATKSEGSAA
jgi:putative FmdB family regulatory protein